MNSHATKSTIVTSPGDKRNLPTRAEAVELRARRHPGSEIFSQVAWKEIAASLRFSKRELQIVQGIFDDQTEYAIAANLGISPHTVHTHLERLRHKLTVVDRAALILQVVEQFLKLTEAPGSIIPPICARRAAGVCQRRD